MEKKSIQFMLSSWTIDLIRKIISRNEIFEANPIIKVNLTYYFLSFDVAIKHIKLRMEREFMNMNSIREPRVVQEGLEGRKGGEKWHNYVVISKIKDTMEAVWNWVSNSYSTSVKLMSSLSNPNQ